ncbi:MBL fold metallo-hydrolase [Candidatus Giovannonibacteria bacterium]|nr:MBL fold metallo-hydrolase [Candidatus Giovannonibacteria bacterium]
MVITYYGLSCFKIQSGDLVLAIDPFTRDSGLTTPRFQTDIALITHKHENHGNLDTLNPKPEKEIFEITGPGEYEVHGVRIKGFESFHDAKEGKNKGKNAIYLIEWEDMKIAHLGDYGEATLRAEVQEALDTPDIMFVPVGGGGHTIDAETAVKLINQVSPRIVVPMHYKIGSLKDKLDPIDDFLKEMGEKVPPEDRLSIKKSGLPTDEESRIVVLKLNI